MTEIVFCTPRTTGKIRAIPPFELRERARKSQNELLFPYPEVLDVIDVATRHGIAVLGVEVT